MVSRLTLAAIALCFAMPVAAAGDTAQVPEGSQVTLFALGVAGVLLGRRLSARRSDRD